MTSDQRKKLSEIKQFKQLIAYLRDEMGWPINSESEFDELTYEYTTTELGIDDKSAAQIQEIKRLRPLSAKQPWGVFFVKFEPKKLPVVALRRILGQVALKKRASANPADRTMWAQEDLLFISNYGEGDDRQITLAHFSVPIGGHTLPSLKVLGWDSKDTVLHLEAVARELTEQLSWPADESDVDAWRAKWRAAFTIGHQEVIKTSERLSIRLAQLARDIRDRIATALTIETEDGPLTKLMKAFQESLIHDLTPKDFADMYAQTIAYGLLSSRIADPKKKSAHDLQAHMQLSPFLQELMKTFLEVGGRKTESGLDFDELGVGEVVDLLDQANMEAVVADFGDKNPEEDPVIHFYELFLKEYDASERMNRGVFYTPRPIVSHIVRSVHETLRTEFGLEDGLADTTTWGAVAKRHKHLVIPKGVSPSEDFVKILDPATGTGTFLVEIIDVVYKTLVTKWKLQGHSEQEIDLLWNDYVPGHLLTRLYGYELLMAPYAICHLKLSLKLKETGYKFKNIGRANIYMTNSLEPAQDFEGSFSFAIPALAHEAKAVNIVKRDQTFTVVVGNPPYSARSFNLTESARAMVARYKNIGGERIKEKGALQLEKNLNDDYVKFFALAQELTNGHPSIVGYITNHSYLENPTLRGLRWNFLEQYPYVHVLDLGGNVARREPFIDENVFDIMQGVAIAILVDPPINAESRTKAGRLRGTRLEKYGALSTGSASIVGLPIVIPIEPLFLFRYEDVNVRSEYYSGLSLAEVFPLNSTGIKTHRDAFCIDLDLPPLKERIEDLVGTKYSDEEIREKYGLSDTHGWTLAKARIKLRADLEREDAYSRVLYRPFDWRYIYFSPNIIELPRMEVSKHFLTKRNIGLVFMRQVASDESYSHFLVTRSPVESRSFYSNRGTMNFAPLFLDGKTQESGGMFTDVALGALTLNLSVELLDQVRRKVKGLSAQDLAPEKLLSYMYGLFHSSMYRSRYAAFLKVDYPRLLLVREGSLFRVLSDLGSKLVALHLFEAPMINDITHQPVEGKPALVGVPAWSNDTIWLDGTKSIGIEGVPESVWNFHIGGYQVCFKWLKDRKGRELTNEELGHYKKMIFVVSQTMGLMEEIDASIERSGGFPSAFNTATG